MPEIVYRVGYIDLAIPEQKWWDSIDARTEVRKAQKSGITVRFIEQAKDAAAIARCQELQQELFAREKIPYAKDIFGELLARPDSLLGVAELEGKIISCVLIIDQPDYSWEGGRIARLEISATDAAYAKLCPNYLLIWQAANYLRTKGYRIFNLDLLYFDNAPDPDLERVAAFKKKWALLEVERRGPVSWPHYIYIRFLKRFHFLKSLVYRFRVG